MQLNRGAGLSAPGPQAVSHGVSRILEPEGGCSAAERGVNYQGGTGVHSEEKTRVRGATGVPGALWDETEEGKYTEREQPLRGVHV